VTMLAGMLVSRNRAAALHTAVFVICCVVLAITSAGGYGTLSAGSTLWLGASPFGATDRLFSISVIYDAFARPASALIAIVLSIAFAGATSSLLSAHKTKIRD